MTPTEKVRSALDNAGASDIEIRIVEQTIFTVDDAAKTIGVNPSEILKSLIFVIDKSEQQSSDDAEYTESVIIGTPRTTADLSAEQKAFLAENKYTVIAVLPEITADFDGQNEFPVELNENAPEGEKLIWLAFPQNSEENDDDKIIDFYDADGKAIENVPAEKSITAAPWMRAGVIYQPAIAVKNPE